jgi:hypothetical protein
MPWSCSDLITSVSSAVPKKGMAHPLAHRLLSSEQITQLFYIDPVPFWLSAFFCPPLLGDSGTQSISGINL